MLLNILDFLNKPMPFVQISLALFLAVLFIQSGLDKVIDWKGNLDWLKGHFSQSPFKNFVMPLLLVITVLENLAGFTSLIGAFQIFFSGESLLAFYGSQLSALSILSLFIGQRIAKDYAGAASLVSYFILTILAVLILGNPSIF